MDSNKRSATIIEDVLKSEEAPMYVGVAYDILCKYIDAHCDKSQLEEFSRREVKKLFGEVDRYIESL